MLFLKAKIFIPPYYGVEELTETASQNLVPPKKHYWGRSCFRQVVTVDVIQTVYDTAPNWHGFLSETVCSN